MQVCKAGLGVLGLPQNILEYQVLRERNSRHLKPLCKEITRFQGGASSFQAGQFPPPPPPGLMSDPVRIVVLSIMGGALHGCSFNVSRQGQGCAL